MKVWEKSNRRKLTIEFIEGGKVVSICGGVIYQIVSDYLASVVNRFDLEENPDITIKGNYDNIKFFLTNTIHFYLIKRPNYPNFNSKEKRSNNK